MTNKVMAMIAHNMAHNSNNKVMEGITRATLRKARAMDNRLMTSMGSRIAHIHLRGRATKHHSTIPTSNSN